MENVDGEHRTLRSTFCDIRTKEGNGRLDFTEWLNRRTDEFRGLSVEQHSSFSSMVRKDIKT